MACFPRVFCWVLLGVSEGLYIIIYSPPSFSVSFKNYISPPRHVAICCQFQKLYIPGMTLPPPYYTYVFLGVSKGLYTKRQLWERFQTDFFFGVNSGV